MCGKMVSHHVGQGPRAGPTIRNACNGAPCSSALDMPFDYDGMFLPKFRGERSLELGHKNYQHPERSSEHYHENVDNFPSLVIYLSLLSIASDPGLWAFHNEDNLILTKSDYADPRSSAVFRRLKRSPDQTVAKLAERLEEYCAFPLEKIPDLEPFCRIFPPAQRCHRRQWRRQQALHRRQSDQRSQPPPATYTGRHFKHDAQHRCHLRHRRPDDDPSRREPPAQAVRGRPRNDSPHR